jgi:hypothetical protein
MVESEGCFVVIRDGGNSLLGGSLDRTVVIIIVIRQGRALRGLLGGGSRFRRAEAGEVIVVIHPLIIIVVEVVFHLGGYNAAINIFKAYSKFVILKFK